MNDLDPNRFRDTLNAALGRFVATSSPVNEVRAPGLATKVRDAVRARQLVKGPYVETLPDFYKGRSLQELEADGLLHPAWQVLSTTSLARPIHGGRSLSVDFMRSRVGVRRLAAPGFEVGSVGVWG